jgi:hypothetical protein
MLTKYFLVCILMKINFEYLSLYIYVHIYIFDVYIYIYILYVKTFEKTYLIEQFPIYCKAYIIIYIISFIGGHHVK